MFGLNKIKESMENVKVKMDRIYTDTIATIDVNCGKLGLDGKTVMKTTSTITAAKAASNMSKVVKDVSDSYRSAKAFEDTANMANMWAKLAMEDSTNKKLMKNAAKYATASYTCNKLSK